MFIISKQSIIFVIISATSSTEILKCTPLSLVLGKLIFFMVSYIHGHTYKETDSFAKRVDFQFRTLPSVKGYFLLQNNTQWLFITGILQNSSRWRLFCKTPPSYFVEHLPVRTGILQTTSQGLIQTEKQVLCEIAPSASRTWCFAKHLPVAK